VDQVLDPVAGQKDRLVEIDTTPSRQVRGSGYGGAVQVGVREGFQEACLAVSQGSQPSCGDERVSIREAVVDRPDGARIDLRHGGA
jgi:hypothetical protein